MAIEINRLADGASALSRPGVTARSASARPPTTPRSPEPDVEAPTRTPTEARTELSQTQRVEARRIGETLRSATQQLGLAQAAEAELDTGITALERLGELANDAQTNPGPNEARGEEARRIAQQLDTTDRGETLQRARGDVETETARRDVERAEQEVERLDRLPPRPRLPRQSTLALVPRLTGDETERARAEQAVDTARRDLARVENSERVVVAGGPVLTPATVDVESAEGGAATAASVEDAVARASSLRQQVRLLGNGAADRARGASEALSANARPRLSDPARAQTAATRVARATIDNPAQALAGQPFVSVQAALRVLS